MHVAPRRWLSLVVLLLVAAPLLGPGPVTGLGTGDAVAAPVDTSRLYLPITGKTYPLPTIGAFLPLVDEATWTTEVNNFESGAGRGHGVYLVSSGFACPWARRVWMIEQYLQHIDSLGAIPLITWVPMDCQPSTGMTGDINAVNLQMIIDGHFDVYIREWARDLTAQQMPVFVRWGHEMNIPSYSWAGQYAFGADGKTRYDVAAGQPCGLTGCFGDPTVPDGPERYIAAYRRVHDLVEQAAPNNTITWVWNPNARNWPLASVAPWNHYNNYYPGDAYVDWIALDGYNWGAQSGNGYAGWVTFNQMFAAELTDLAQRHPAKPQMIAEIASVEDPHDPNRKANFIRDAYQAARRFPKLRVMIWVHDSGFWDPDCDTNGIPGPEGCRASFEVNSSPQALAAYKEAILAWSTEIPLLR
jgi:hypothetical protein